MINPDIYKPHKWLKYLFKANKRNRKLRKMTKNKETNKVDEEKILKY